MIHIDSGQKRVLKAMAGAGLGMIAGTLIYYVCSGKIMESWIDALSISVLNLLITFGIGSLFVFGSKTPKKGE